MDLASPIRWSLKPLWVFDARVWRKAVKSLERLSLGGRERVHRVVRFDITRGAMHRMMVGSPGSGWRVLCACAASLALVFVVAPDASARITLGQGVAGIALGDKGSRVRHVLGKPRIVQKYSGGQSWFFQGYWVTLDGRTQVSGIEVRRPSEQATDRGIKLGSTYSTFRTAYAGARCHSDAPFNRVYRICALKTRDGHRVVENRFVFGQDKLITLIDIGNVGEFA